MAARGADAGTTREIDALQRRVAELESMVAERDSDLAAASARLSREAREREQAEAARRESERRVRAIFDQTFQFIAMLEPDGTVVEVNRTALRFAGAVPAEVLGRPFWDTPWWSHSPRLQERLRQAVASAARGEFVRFEATHPGPGGAVAYIDFSLKPVKDETGEVEFLIPEGRDITEHKRDEARLRERTAALAESELKYRTLVENVPLVVYRLSPDGEVLFVNRFVEEAFGYSPEEVLRDPGLWSRWVDEEDRPTVEGFRAKGVREGREFLAEYRVRHREGKTVHVLDHAIPSRDAEGRVSSVGGILLDVTGRVKLRKERMRAKELETLNEVAARLAHEFRNPLTSVGGFARRLLAGLPPQDPNRRLVEVIVQDVARLEAILGVVLTYIQPLELALSPTDPRRIVEAALEAIRGTAQAARVRVEQSPAPTGLWISADAPRLEAALETLLRNALASMKEGEVLAVESWVEGDMFHLALRYPAQAVSPDDIVDFFYPVTSPRMLQRAEWLPMSKVLVHKHGGTLDVALDEPGRIVLRLALPLLKSLRPATA
ncbi:MAG: PAS domain S-box protein [Deferrisomatales bacterium]|nr:PAS domain S-box protein [Deferrisomatales bacterium]